MAVEITDNNMITLSELIFALFLTALFSGFITLLFVKVLCSPNTEDEIRLLRHDICATMGILDGMKAIDLQYMESARIRTMDFDEACRVAAKVPTNTYTAAASMANIKNYEVSDLIKELYKVKPDATIVEVYNYLFSTSIDKAGL